MKRKAQNRAAQRAFRERKERYVKELEAKIKQLQDNHFHASSQLVQENQHLRSVVYRLEAENFALKGIHIQFPIHPSPYIMYTPPTSNGAAPVNAAASPQTSTHPHHPHHPPLLAPAMPTTPSPPPPMHQQQHQQQYTFSISTPATLRPKKPASETASSTATATNSSSPPSSSSSQEQFCQILHNQVSNNVIEQLLSEPLFDTSGGLVIQHAHQGATATPPTTTTTSTSIPTPNHNATTTTTTTGLLTTAEVWQRLSQHDHFSLFTVEELCNQVARHIKSTHQGLALEERDLEAVFREMDLAKKS